VPVTDLRKLIDKGQLTDGPSLLGLSLALAAAAGGRVAGIQMSSGQ
jgi:hypothetical protein